MHIVNNKYFMTIFAHLEKVITEGNEVKIQYELNKAVLLIDILLYIPKDELKLSHPTIYTYLYC